MLTLPPIIAHRGASAVAPENTLVAMQAAKARGAIMIECDLRLTCGQQLVVIHDARLERTTNGRGRVNQRSLSYLSKLDAGAWFGESFKHVGMPTAAGLLKFLQVNAMQANLELKPSPGEASAMAHAVIKLLAGHWRNSQHWPLISSSSVKTLTLLHKLAPQLPLALVCTRWSPNIWSQAHALSLFSLHLSKRLLTPARVQKIQQMGFRCAAFTVNQAEQAKQLFHMGVDSVFSDHPDLLNTEFDRS